jgi:hypothetical protein
MRKIFSFWAFVGLIYATMGTIAAQVPPPQPKPQQKPPVHYGGKIAGFAVGFIIVLGIWRLTKSVRKQNK